MIATSALELPITGVIGSLSRVVTLFAIRRSCAFACSACSEADGALIAEVASGATATATATKRSNGLKLNCRMTKPYFTVW